jgi:hypothetical protein
MPTWQFDSHLTPEGSVVIPPDVVAQMHPQDAVKVILTTDEESIDWQRMTAEQFLQGYDPGDEIYDKLPNG